MKLGLILVDIQNDYFKGGKYELVEPEQAAMNANRILTYFRTNNLPIIHVRHINLKPDAAFFLPDTEGSDFYKEVYPLEGEDIIIKHKPDSFFNTNLDVILKKRNVDTLVICGMMTHMCIDTTVRSAGNYGFPVTLIEDACATRDLKWGDTIVPGKQVQCAYLAALNGMFAKVQKADSWIHENE